MRVKIYKLRREAADWVIDEKHPVAEVTIKDGQGSFRFYDRGREKLLRQLFTEPARAFRGGGETSDGAHFDAFVTYPVWTREAIELIVSDILRGYSLGGKIIDDEVSVTKSSFIRPAIILLGLGFTTPLIPKPVIFIGKVLTRVSFRSEWTVGGWIHRNLTICSLSHPISTIKHILAHSGKYGMLSP